MLPSSQRRERSMTGRSQRAGLAVALLWAASAHAQSITYELSASYMPAPQGPPQFSGQGSLAGGEFSYDVADGAISNVSTAFLTDLLAPASFSYQGPAGSGPASLTLSSPTCSTSFCSESMSFDLSAPLGILQPITLQDVVFDAPVPNVTDDIPCGSYFICSGSIQALYETPAAAPEIDPTGAAGALSLLLGALAICRGRLGRSRDSARLGGMPKQTL